MVDLELLKSRGVSAEHWEKIFKEPPNTNLEGNPKTATAELTKDEKITRLRNIIWDRCRKGRDWCISNHRTIHALDLLWDAPWKQISPTLIASIADKVKTTKEAEAAFKQMGLDISKVIRTETDPKTGQPVQVLDIPVFVFTVMPLLRSYLRMRNAKLVNDRNNTPLIPYYPALNTPDNRIRAASIATRVEVMNQQYSLVNIVDQATWQMLLYHQSLVFTKEEWHTEKQERYKRDEKKKKGKETEEFITKEGLRHFISHPSKTYYDLTHSARTLNTSTGCRFAGYWNVMMYKELKAMGGFYNLDRVSLGTQSNTWWTGESATLYWETMYGGCTIRSPFSVDPNTSKDKDAVVEGQYYTGTHDDTYCEVHEHRELLNPKEWGLGDYDHDIWCRFVTAGEGTIIYAAPMGYDPVLCCRDTGDDRRPMEASQGLLLAGFQDQVGNLLTQYLYAVKQNLTNITVVDKNIFSGDDEKKTRNRLENVGSTLWRGINIFWADLKKLRVGQTSPVEAFYSHRFPHLDTNSIIQAIKLVIEMAERVLGFSSQEIGQAASHEQTRAEIRHIEVNTSNGLAYTGMHVDAFIQAMGRQCYEALMNYGSEDFWATIPLDEGVTPESLKKLGFDMPEGEMGVSDRKRALVKVPKSAVELMQFANVPQNDQIVPNYEAAQALATWLRDLMMSPYAATIGPDQFIDISNQIAKLAGLRLENKLKNTGVEPSTPEQKMQEAQAIVEQVIQATRQEMKAGMAPMLEALEDHAGQLQQIQVNLQKLGIPFNGSRTPQPPMVPEGNPRPSGIPQPQPAPGIGEAPSVPGVMF